MPGDLYHLFTKPNQFIAGRVSPLVGKTGQWLLTGRDYRGMDLPATEFAKQLAMAWLPISIRGVVPGASVNKDITAWETFMNAMGLATARYSPLTHIYAMIDDWKTDKGLPKQQGVYPVSKFRDVRNSLQDNNMEKTIYYWNELLKDKEAENIEGEGTTEKKLRKAFSQSLLRPFTGSSEVDKEFRKSLNSIDQAVFDEAVKSKWRYWVRFNEMMKEAGKLTPEELREMMQGVMASFRVQRSREMKSTLEKTLKSPEDEQQKAIQEVIEQEMKEFETTQNKLKNIKTLMPENKAPKPVTMPVTMYDPGM